MRPLARLLDITLLLTREDLSKILTSPLSDRDWTAAVLYHSVFVMVTCMTVGMAMERVAAYWGWRYALLVIWPLTGTLLAFWAKEEVAIFFAFGVLGLVTHYWDRLVKARKRRPT